MRIKSDQMRNLEDWLQARTRRCVCQCCDASDWEIGEIVSLLPDDLCNQMVGQRPSVVQVICRHCANVLSFDLERLKRMQVLETAKAPATAFGFPANAVIPQPNGKH